MGFGTERVEQEIARLIPEARVARLDGDTSSSESSFKRIVREFETGATNILVGTQILGKGFDFGGVTTVGILNADNLLSAPDFRAAERAYQLITQVAGRAGRRDSRGHVVVQTSMPNHPVIREVAYGSYRNMALAELREREAFGYPPYSHLVRLLLRHKDSSLLGDGARFVAEVMRRKFGSRVLGPAAAAVERLRGEYRMEILLKIESGASMRRARQLLREVLSKVEADVKYKSLIINVDVDCW